MNNTTNGVLVVSEADCHRLVDRQAAFSAVKAVFSAMDSGKARNFPVIREAIGHAGALYGFKSGFDRAGLVLGVKSGGYWPGNIAKGLTNHQSTVFLFDPDTGQLKALVAGNHLTALRTAASSAISIACLSRKDSKVLGMVGAGHQSGYQLRAALEQRDFERIIGWNLHPEMLSGLGEIAKEHDLPFDAVPVEEMGRADVIITITSSQSALLSAEWIKPGTHLACMGTDTVGKQEVDAVLVASASVFSDEVAQSISIGEAQHAFGAGTIEEGDITPIGAVINGTHPGRISEEEVTLFDGTGVGLQDLAVAGVAVDASVASDTAVVVDF